MIEVVVVDDHRLVRKGITTLLAGTDGIAVVGEGENGREAIQLAQTLHPDVVVMDISMPQMNGIEALERLKGDGNPPVIFLSMHGDTNLVRRALDAGAAGYVLKRAATRELVEGIKAVNAGSHYLSSDLRQQLHC